MQDRHECTLNNSLHQTQVQPQEATNLTILHLEKQNKVNKEIRQLSTENGDVISGQDGISNEIFKFYSNLYKAKDTEEVDIDTLLNYPDIPKLTQNCPNY